MNLTTSELRSVAKTMERLQKAIDATPSLVEDLIVVDSVVLRFRGDTAAEEPIEVKYQASWGEGLFTLAVAE